MIAFMKDLFNMTAALFRKIPKKTYELVAIVLLAAILVVDLGYHLVQSLADKPECAPAKISSLSETCALYSLILRDEIPLAVQSDRYLVLCEEGERVNVGTELIRCYAPAASEETLAALSAEYALRAILKDVATARLDKVKSTLELQIEGVMLQIDRATASGNAVLAAREERELSALMLMRERVLGTVSLDALIKENAARIASCEAALGAPISSVYAQSTGWFSQHCDGYEGLLTPEEIYQKDISALTALFDVTPQEPAKAKLILSYETVSLAVTDEATARRFSQNTKYRVNADGSELDLKLDKAVIENRNPSVALIFKNQALSKTLPLRRISRLSVTLKTHEGFKIPTASIVEEGGVYGVYILKGFRVEFREISIIYRDGNTAVCAVSFEPTAYRILAENDNVIIKGEDLYDGKIVPRLY